MPDMKDIVTDDMVKNALKSDAVNQSPTDNDKAKGAASVKTQPVTASVTQPSDADRRSVTNRGIT